MTRLAVFIFVSTSLLASVVTFEPPQWGGSGCSNNSVSWALSPDNSSLSILFSEFSLNAFCEMRILVYAREPNSLQVDYRGFADLPDQVISTQRTEYALSSHQAQIHVDSFVGPNTSTYVYRHQPSVSCTGAQVLKIFVRTWLSGNSLENASYTLDSIDLSQAHTNGAGSVFSPWIFLATLLFLHI